MDLCALQRPLDDRTQPRVDREAAAVDVILEEMRAGRVTVLGSQFLIDEASLASDVRKRVATLNLIATLGEWVQRDAELASSIGTLIAAGFTIYDASHFACAIVAGVDVFCTCDDRLLRKARSVAPGGLRVLLPQELALEVSP